MPTSVQEKIRRALRRGPLYEPVLAYAVGASPAHVRRVLRHMRAAGEVELVPPATWRLTEEE